MVLVDISGLQVLCLYFLVVSLVRGSGLSWVYVHGVVVFLTVIVIIIYGIVVSLVEMVNGFG